MNPDLQLMTPRTCPVCQGPTGQTTAVCSSACFDRMQIEQAARGCISGPLKEWPALDKALKVRGWNLPRDTTSQTLRLLCKGMAKARGWL